jgi:hypothetical protein
MDAALPLAMRWLHIAVVVILLGGVFYARFVEGVMSARFKPWGYAAIGGILDLRNLQFPEQKYVSAALSCMVRYQSVTSPARFRHRGDVQPGTAQNETAVAHRCGDHRSADPGLLGVLRWLGLQ